MPDFQTILGWLGRAEVQAILAGLLISWNVTQFAKNAPAVVALSDWTRRWVTRLLAFLVGAIPTLVIWPEADSARAIVAAVCVGASSPAAYTLAARVLYHYFPWLEVKMSAVPVAKRSQEPAP